MHPYARFVCVVFYVHFAFADGRHFFTLHCPTLPRRVYLASPPSSKKLAGYYVARLIFLLPQIETASVISLI